MEMSGLCHICGKPTNLSCRMCGLLTCERHLKDGVCTECRKGTLSRSKESEEESRHYEENLYK